MKIVNPRKKRGVHHRLGRMARQDGGDPAFDLTHLIVTVHTGKVEEDGGDARQRLARPLQRLDRIGECWRGGIARDGLHICSILRQRRLESGAEMGGFDGVEGRDAKGRVPVGQ